MPPLFEYNCALCGSHIESVQKFESASPTCCGSFTSRLVSVPSVAVFLKDGTGAQRDDHARN
jgi:putative FmdB family regulatory protein